MSKRFSRPSLVRPRLPRACRRLAVLAAALLCGASLPLAGLAAAPASAAQGSAVHFMFTTASGNTVGDSAYIDSAETNGQRGLMLFVTPNYDPFGLCGCVFDPEPVGVWYDTTLNEWAVFNENGAQMPQRESFNVLVLPVSFTNHTVFVTDAITANTVGDYTFIENSNSDGNPNAKIQVTQSWDPGGFGGTYNPHPVGVFYDNAAGLWAIFNEDQAPMPIGASFDVLVNTSKRNGGGKVALLRTTRANSSDDSTYIDNPLTNGNPDNVTLATPNYDPGGKGGTYNDIQTGVWYPSEGPREAVFNENGSAPPLQSADNLLIFPS